jgi:hypothetical protein
MFLQFSGVVNTIMDVRNIAFMVPVMKFCFVFGQSSNSYENSKSSAAVAFFLIVLFVI